jgi:hypothetical protein
MVGGGGGQDLLDPYTKLAMKLAHLSLSVTSVATDVQLALLLCGVMSLCV